MTALTADTPLPRLRKDVNLHRGPAQRDGAPSWTLYDPSSNRFFRIGMLEFECLARFSCKQTIGDIVKSVNKETVLDVTEDDVKGIVEFLSSSELIITPTSQATKRFTELHSFRQQSWWKKFIHGYLFFIMPLVKPERFLRATLPYVRPLLTRQFFTIMLCVLGYGLYLTAKRWDEFLNTFMHFFSWEGLAFYMITITCVKIVHELGHAYTATKAGVRVSSMGIAFIVLYPVLYTETTGAWKLPDRRRRLLIGAGGVMAEICVAAIALLLWHILPDGAPRSVAFFVATVSLAGSFLVNLNPFMRFDGYYLLSDGLGMDNLQGRAFDLAKWNMRRFLFGWKNSPPELFENSLRRTLYLYAYGTWIYRFFLFLGIAILVYTLFFQPLGFVLMVVELTWFIGLPIYRELIVWKRGLNQMSLNFASLRTIGTLVILMGVMFIPWHSTVNVPAFIQAREYTQLYPSAPARIVEVSVDIGANVKHNDILLKLESPTLNYRIDQARNALKSLEAQTLREGADRKLIHRVQIRQQQIAEAQAKLDSLLDQKEKLTVRAPFDGVVVEKAPNLHVDRWVNESLPLIHLVQMDRSVLHGYIYEEDIRTVREGMEGHFYSDTGIYTKVKVRVAQVGQTKISALERPDLASVYGGPVAIEPAAGEKGGSLIPHDTVYAVVMEPVHPENVDVPVHLVSGEVKLQGIRKSFARRAFIRIGALVVREVGL